MPTTRVFPRPHKFFLPAGFEPKEVLSSKLADYEDEARYLVASILRKMAFEDVDIKGFAHLHSRILRRVVGPNRLGPFWNCLEAAGVVERGGYWASRYSRGYKLTDTWTSRERQIVRATDLGFLQRVTKEREHMETTARREWLPIHHKLNELQQGLRITDEVDDLFAALPADEHAALLCQRYLISHLRHRQLSFSVSSTGRVFNAISGLKSTFRTALRLDEHRVGGIDICCAQPALLALLIRSCCPTIGWSSTETYKVFPGLSSLLLSCPDVARARRVGVARREFELFRREVCEEDLYARLSSALDRPREFAKKRLLVDFLAKRGGYPSEVEDCFAAQFPGVFAFVKAVNAENHCALIRLLQRLESWLVVETVCPLLVSQTPILTLHDCIYGPVGWLDFIESAFREVFARLDFWMRLSRSPKEPAAAERDSAVALAA